MHELSDYVPKELKQCLQSLITKSLVLTFRLAEGFVTVKRQDRQQVLLG